MYKFQSDKPNRQQAIDGFLSSGPRRSKLDPKTSTKKNLSEAMLKSNQVKLDDFKKPDGFRGRSVPSLNVNGARQVAAPPVLSNGRRRSLSDPAALAALKRRKRHKKNSWKVFTRASIFIVVAVIGLSAFMFGKAWWSAHKVFKGGGSALFNKNIDPHMLNGEGDGRVNILVMGKGGATEAAGGELTDSMMIVSIDPINDKVALMSIPRDLWVKPSGLWPMKINAVYSSAKYKALDLNPKDKAGAEAAGMAKSASVVEQYLGVHMHYYGMVEFSAFQEAVNTLGGIDVTLPAAYSDYSMLVGKKYLSLPAGAQHLDGGMALAYARSRHGAERGDFDRGEHQQIIIVGIKDKVLSLGTFANPLKVTQLLNTFGNRIQTNLSIDDMMRIYGIVKQLGPNAITHADLAQKSNPVVTTGAVGDQSVVIPKLGVDDFTDVKAFVRNTLKDGFLVKENPSVIILNGSNNPGAANKRAKELKGYGYNVIKVADSPNKNITSTQLIDFTKGVKKYTKRYLEQRLGVMAVKSLDGIDYTQYQADFVIVVGP